MFARTLFTALFALVLAAAVPASDASAGLGAESGPITPEEGATLIRQKADLVILDVRTPAEYARQHYPNALNIPVSDLAQRVSDVPAGKSVLIHCARGIRAARAYELLQKQRPDIAELYYIKGSPVF
jgi:rhodanese-related sulfurtransferase